MSNDMRLYDLGKKKCTKNKSYHEITREFVTIKTCRLNLLKLITFFSFIFSVINCSKSN